MDRIRKGEKVKRAKGERREAICSLSPFPLL
jgi:hypothetical protein